MHEHYKQAYLHNLRIEMQILSLHRMMQNIRLFNVCEARRASRGHLKVNIFASSSAS